MEGLQRVTSYKKSSIWLGLKKLWPTLRNNLQWIIGDGNLVRFWKDKWLGDELLMALNYDQHVHPFLNDKVCGFIDNKEWKIPWSFQSTHPEIVEAILRVPLPAEDCSDKPVWAPESSGALTAKAAYQFLSEQQPESSWGKKIWHHAIQPRKSLVTWKVMLRKIPTEENLQRRGRSLCSRCYLCSAAVESTEHLFWSCAATATIWGWVMPLFRIQLTQDIEVSQLLLEHLITTLSFSSKALWYISVCNILWCIWTERNGLKHVGGVFDSFKFKQRVILSIKESASLVFGPSSNIQTVPIFNVLGLSQLRPSAPRIVQVVWVPPPAHWVKVNTDGSFHDQLHAGYGGIFRDGEASFLGAFAYKATVPCALDAEVLAVIEAISIANSKGWLNLWVEVDSLTLLTYFRDLNRIPWRLRTKWRNCLHKSQHMSIHFSHIFREGNSVADRLANFGASQDDSIWWDAVPLFLLPVFQHDFCSRPSYRFS